MALGNLLLIVLVCRHTFAGDTGESLGHQKRFFHSSSPSYYSSLSSYKIGHAPLTIDENPWKLNSYGLGHKPVIKDVNPWELSSPGINPWELSPQGLNPWELSSQGIGLQSLGTGVLSKKPGPFGLGHQSLTVDTNPWKPIIKNSHPLTYSTGLNSVVKDLTSWPEKQTIEPIKKVPLEQLPLQQAAPLPVPEHPIVPCPVPVEKPIVPPPIENQIVHRPVDVTLPQPQPLPVSLPIISHLHQALPHPLLAPHAGVQGLLPQRLHVLHGLPQLLPLSPNIPAPGLLGYSVPGLAAHAPLRLPLNLIANQGLLNLPPSLSIVPAHGLLGHSSNSLFAHPLPLTAPAVQGHLLHGPTPAVPGHLLHGPAPAVQGHLLQGPAPLVQGHLLQGPAPLVQGHLLQSPAAVLPGHLLHNLQPGFGHNLVSGLYPGATAQGKHLHAKRSKDKGDQEDNDGKNT